MKRATSIAAYNQIVEEGLLVKLKLEVYKIVCEHGPMTASEMLNIVGSTRNSGAFVTRLSELERMKVVKTSGKRPCKITGREALIWEITGGLPVKEAPRKTKKQKLAEIMEEMKIFADKYHKSEPSRSELRSIARKVKLL